MQLETTMVATPIGSFRDRNILALHLILIIALCVATGILSVSQGTDSNWDLKNYHMYSAYAFFQNRLSYDIAPAQAQTYFSPLFDLHYYLLVEYLNEWPRLVAFIQGIPAGVYAYLCFRISLIVASAMITSGMTSWVCAALSTVLGMTGAGVLPLIGAQTGDVLVGVPTLASLAVILACFGHHGPHIWRLAAAGFLAGIALGGKLTAIIYCIPLEVLVLAMFGLWSATTFGVTMALTFLALWGPHAWRLWIAFGNPFFPYYNEIFRSPDWLPYALSTARPHPSNLMELIFYPFSWAQPQQGLVTELLMQDLRLSFLFAAVSVLGLIAVSHIAKLGIRGTFSEAFAKLRVELQNNRVAVVLIIFIILSYVLWLKLFAIYRYLIVIETLTGAGLIIVLAYIFHTRPAPIVGMLAIATVAANFFVVRPDWGHVPHGSQVISFEPIPVLPHDLIVMADDSPQSYIVPFLPGDSRVISIKSNFINPSDTHGLHRRIVQILNSNSAGFLIISAPETAREKLNNTLAQYGLSAHDCIIVRSNWVPTGHRMCRGSRQTEVQ